MKSGLTNKKTYFSGLILLIVLCAGLIVPITVGAEELKPVVKTDSGWLMGTIADEKTVAWLGVPYAKPPVGELRWKAPQTPDSWKDLRHADAFSEPCAQADLQGQSFGSEDCLYLNVWRPKYKTPRYFLWMWSDNLPVYFWIHGGSNRSGSGSDPLIDGAYLAAKTNMIVVSINYRLGSLGWLSHPALRHGENAADDSGNYGLLDIVAALEWVQNNIAAFGGDPDNVTVAGESAGAMDIMTLLTTSMAPGLFNRAILESGLFTSRTVSEGDQNADNFIRNLLIVDGSAADQDAAENLLAEMNDSEVEAYLRAKSCQELLAVTTIRGVASEDGVIVPEQARAKISSGDYYKVPTIIGSNKDEITYFAISQYKNLIATYGQATAALLYGKLNYYGSLLWKIKGVDELAADMSKYQESVFVYHFAWDEEPFPYSMLLGACHGIDVPFFFNSFDRIGEPFKSMAITEANLPSRTALSQNMLAYWSEFAHTDSPGSGGAELQNWEAWQDGLPNCINLDSEISFSQTEATLANLLLALAAEDTAVQDFVWGYLNQLDLF